jgi:hypothetical protein
MRVGVAVAFCLFAAGFAAVAEIPDLEGTWAMVQVYPQIAILPIAGEVPRSSTVAQLVEATQSGSRLTMRDSYCFTDVDDGTSIVETVIPDQFMDSLRPEPRTAILIEQTASVRFESSPYVEVRGAVLDDPFSDPLPVDVSDPRVFDQDGDGNPGMTVRVTILGLVEGETYVVQRVSYRLSGVMVGSDRIEGTIEWTDEQVVLGATNELLKADTIGKLDPDPAAHRFVMVRVDETWTCKTLRERMAEILSASGS